MEWTVMLKRGGDWNDLARNRQILQNLLRKAVFSMVVVVAAVAAAVVAVVVGY
jgi:hypothetical protein